MNSMIMVSNKYQKQSLQMQELHQHFQLIHLSQMSNYQISYRLNWHKKKLPITIISILINRITTIRRRITPLRKQPINLASLYQLVREILIPQNQRNLSHFDQNLLQTIQMIKLRLEYNQILNNQLKSTIAIQLSHKVLLVVSITIISLNFRKVDRKLRKMLKIIIKLVMIKSVA